MMIDLQCVHCRHFHRPPASGPYVLSCAAFPGAIPREIQVAEHDHRKPFPGDHGVRFKPRSGADTTARPH